MNPPESFRIESVRQGRTSTITLQRGQCVCSVAVDGRDVLSKIRGLPWTVADGVEPWELADAAKALCL